MFYKVSNGGTAVKLLTTITGNGSYTYEGSDKSNLTSANFMVCVNYCTGTSTALGFVSGDVASKSYNPSTGVLTLSNMVKYSGAGATPGKWTFRANVYLVK